MTDEDEERIRQYMRVHMEMDKLVLLLLNAITSACLRDHGVTRMQMAALRQVYQSMEVEIMILDQMEGPLFPQKPETQS